MSTFDDPDVGKVMKKVFLDIVWAQKCEKSCLLSKASVSGERVRVRVCVSFSRKENVDFRRTRWCPRLRKG